MDRSHLSVTLALSLGLCLATAVLAQAPNRAALVVTLQDGEVITRCIDFLEESVTGFELLGRSGLAVDASVAASGVTVCSIEAAGCPVNDCFCHCKGGDDCLYWSYWHVVEDKWRYSQVGASVYPVQDGAVEGWVWGVGAPNEAPEPPAFSFEQICPADSSALKTEEQAAGTSSTSPLQDSASMQVDSTELETKAMPAGTESDAGSSRATLFPYALFLILLSIGAVLLRNKAKLDAES